MVREKGKRRGEADETIVRHQVKGEVEAIVDSRVLVEADKIFNRGLFEEECQVILVEGGPGMGKTSLTYYYSQEWAAGKLSMFDVVAVVYLRELAATPASTLPDLLLLAARPSGNNKDIIREMIQKYLMKCPRLLLVLDGWDETPSELREHSFVRETATSISAKSKILITTRPESSVVLHGIANRVEIVGFTKENIDKYFKKALSKELSQDSLVDDGCTKLREHCRNNPVIQSCCSIPLNAAILAHLFLTKQSLPSTRHKLFLKLVMSLIEREIQERYSQRDATVLFLDVITVPHEYKNTLNHICVLAFEGVKQNKVVFTKEDLVHLKLPHCFPALGLLKIVESFGEHGKTVSRYFIHLSIQELLAAYHISRLGEDEQVKVFQELLNEPRFSAVLQFYAAFTRLTNQGVQDIILKRVDCETTKPRLTLLTFIRCLYEANLPNELCQKVLSKLEGKLDLRFVNMTPYDCISVRHFLATLPKSGELSVHLAYCSIDDHSLDLLVGKFPTHAEVCWQSGITTMKRLDVCWCSISDVGAQSLAKAIIAGNTSIRLEYLNISDNKIGDNGIVHIATALQKNTTMKELDVHKCSISDVGAKSLAEAIAGNTSIRLLNISDNKIGDNGIVHIATALQKNTTMKELDVHKCSISDVGAQSLAEAIAGNTRLEYLNISDNKIRDNGMVHIATAFHTFKTLLADWTSTLPDNTLTEMASKFFHNKSTLSKLDIIIFMPHTDEAEVSVKEWHRRVEKGGKKLMQSLENSCLSELYLVVWPKIGPQTRTSLDEAARSVNSARSEKGRSSIKFLGNCFCDHA